MKIFTDLTPDQRVMALVLAWLVSIGFLMVVLRPAVCLVRVLGRRLKEQYPGDSGERNLNFMVAWEVITVATALLISGSWFFVGMAMVGLNAGLYFWKTRG